MKSARSHHRTAPRGEDPHARVNCAERARVMTAAAVSKTRHFNALGYPRCTVARWLQFEWVVEVARTGGPVLVREDKAPVPPVFDFLDAAGQHASPFDHRDPLLDGLDAKAARAQIRPFHR